MEKITEMTDTEMAELLQGFFGDQFLIEILRIRESQPHGTMSLKSIMCKLGEYAPKMKYQLQAEIAQRLDDMNGRDLFDTATGW